MTKPSDKGFTLIEALVALVIIAVAVGGFYRSLEFTARGARIAARDAAALTVARQRLNEAATSVNQAPGVTSGEASDGIRWTTAVSEHAGPASLAGAGEGPSGVRLYRVDVRVDWRDVPGRPSRALALVTFKRAPAS